MLRKLFLLLLVSSFTLFSMDKKTWYIERDKWKPGVSSKVPAEFESFDKIVEALKKAAPSRKDANLRLLIMQLINRKIKECLVTVLNQSGNYKHEPKDKLVPADITDNFVITQEIEDAEIQPSIRELKNEINKFINEVITCILFEQDDYFRVVQPKLFSLKPIAYINEKTIVDLNRYLYEIEQTAQELFADIPVADKLKKLEVRKKHIFDLEFDSIEETDKRNNLRQKLANALTYPVRDLEGIAFKEKERKDREKKDLEQKEKEQAAAASTIKTAETGVAVTTKSDDLTNLYELAGSLGYLSRVAKTPPPLPPLKSKEVLLLPPVPSKPQGKAGPSLPPLPSNGKKTSPPLPPLAAVTNGKKVTPTPPPPPAFGAKAKTEGYAADVKAEPKKQPEQESSATAPAKVESTEMAPLGAGRAKPLAKRKKATTKKVIEDLRKIAEDKKKAREAALTQEATVAPVVEEAPVVKKEVATQIENINRINRQIRAFEMKKMTIDPEAFAEVLAELEDWRDKYQISDELAKEYTQLRDKIISEYKKRFEDKDPQLAKLLNLIIQIRAEKES